MKADLDQIKRTIRDQAIKLSFHAYEEAFAERISVDEIREALLNGTIIEDYATHRRGPCCLVHGQTDTGRDLHLVITSSLSPVLVITVYEPKAPFWITPVMRGKRGEQ